MASSSLSHKRIDGRSVLEPLGGILRKAEESVRSYNVFINHRGPDVKETLALQLYYSLEKLGIPAFLDKEEKEPGVSFPSSIKAAIQSARVHIAIFSKGYAESSWCLDELLLMLKTEAKIIPMFYQVEPWELRHIEKGSYDQAFKNYEVKSRYIEKLEEWKGALNRMSYVAGYIISELPAAGVCKEIVAAVQKEMQTMDFLHVAKYPVGLSKLVEEVEIWCLSDLLQDSASQYGILNEDGQGKARIVGIAGMGGTGKTTLSKELFNKYRPKYTRASFLGDVREAASRNALTSLQLKLLKDLFDEEHPSFTSEGNGIIYLQKRLKRIKYVSFLVVLDDIDDLNQLDYLLVNDMLNKSGNSLIIITTRNAGLLRRAKIPTHNLKGLDQDDSRNLFCLHAFGESNPARGYENLVEAFVKECGGIPLSLQTLGGHVKGGDLQYWTSALRKVEKTLPQEIMEKLKISFDSLDGEEKQIFMDIACYFIGKSKYMALKIWEGSGWVAHHALETLKEKCLVQEIQNKHLDEIKWERDGIYLEMHDHLRDLGREMADLCRDPCRIRKHEDLKSLEPNRAFKAIIEETKRRCFYSVFDTSVGSHFTFFLAGGLASLLWLHLDLDPPATWSTTSRMDLEKSERLRISDGGLQNGSILSCIPLQNWQCFRISNAGLQNGSIPSWIPLEKLQCLRMSNGRLQRLWKTHHEAPLQLKELQIYKTFLNEVPDLGILNKLENVVLDAEYMAIKGWSLLESLKLNCSALHWNSSTLEGNLASNDSRGTATCGSLIIRNFQESPELELNKFPLSGLKNLVIGNQKSATKTSISGNHYTCLKTLILHRMKKMTEIKLFKLMTLNSLEITHCENLEKLTYSECPQLRELFLAHLSCLETMRVGNCEQLENGSGLSDVRKLVMFNINQCHRIQEFSLVQLTCLERFIIEDCKNLKRVSGISHLPKLVDLSISECPELESKLRLPSMYCLEKIAVDGCRKLKFLELIDCKNLKMVSGLDLHELAILNIRGCPELVQLSASNLCCQGRITFDGCEKLNCRAFYSLLNLKVMTFDIGRAVVGAESILNQSFFSETHISADRVTKIDIPCPAIDQALVSNIIICGLVVVERSTTRQCINYRSEEFHLRKGRWIVTMVIAEPKRNISFIGAAVEGMCYGILNKGFRITLTKGEEQITRHIIKRIDHKLYQK